MAEIYEGPVVFVEGVHYPVDEEGHADTSRPLRVDPDGGWRAAADGEALHNEAFQSRDVNLDLGEEVPA